MSPLDPLDFKISLFSILRAHLSSLEAGGGANIWHKRRGILSLPQLKGVLRSDYQSRWIKYNVDNPNLQSPDGEDYIFGCLVQPPWGDILMSRLVRQFTFSKYDHNYFGLLIPSVKIKINRTKTVETRAYPYPPNLLGISIAIFEPIDDHPTIKASCKNDKVEFVITGHMVVSDCIVYFDRNEWDDDYIRNKVPPGNKYAPLENYEASQTGTETMVRIVGYTFNKIEIYIICDRLTYSLNLDRSLPPEQVISTAG